MIKILEKDPNNFKRFKIVLFNFEGDAETICENLIKDTGVHWNFDVGTMHKPWGYETTFWTDILDDRDTRKKLKGTQVTLCQEKAKVNLVMESSSVKRAGRKKATQKSTSSATDNA